MEGTNISDVPIANMELILSDEETGDLRSGSGEKLESISSNDLEEESVIVLKCYDLISSGDENDPENYETISSEEDNAFSNSGNLEEIESQSKINEELEDISENDLIEENIASSRPDMENAESFKLNLKVPSKNSQLLKLGNCVQESLVSSDQSMSDDDCLTYKKKRLKRFKKFEVTKLPMPLEAKVIDDVFPSCDRKNRLGIKICNTLTGEANQCKFDLRNLLNRINKDTIQKTPENKNITSLINIKPVALKVEDNSLLLDIKKENNVNEIKDALVPSTIGNDLPLPKEGNRKKHFKRSNSKLLELGTAFKSFVDPKKEDNTVSSNLSSDLITNTEEVVSIEMALNETKQNTNKDKDNNEMEIFFEKIQEQLTNIYEEKKSHKLSCMVNTKSEKVLENVVLVGDIFFNNLIDQALKTFNFHVKHVFKPYLLVDEVKEIIQDLKLDGLHRTLVVCSVGWFDILKLSLFSDNSFFNIPKIIFEKIRNLREDPKIFNSGFDLHFIEVPLINIENFMERYLAQSIQTLARLSLEVLKSSYFLNNKISIYRPRFLYQNDKLLQILPNFENLYSSKDEKVFLRKRKFRLTSWKSHDSILGHSITCHKKMVALLKQIKLLKVFDEIYLVSNYEYSDILIGDQKCNLLLLTGPQISNKEIITNLRGKIKMDQNSLIVLQFHVKDFLIFNKNNPSSTCQNLSIHQSFSWSPKDFILNYAIKKIINLEREICSHYVGVQMIFAEIPMIDLLMFQEALHFCETCPKYFLDKSNTSITIAECTKNLKDSLSKINKWIKNNAICKGFLPLKIEEEISFDKYVMPYKNSFKENDIANIVFNVKSICEVESWVKPEEKDNIIDSRTPSLSPPFSRHTLMESQEYIEKSSELSKSCINHSVSQLPVSQKETHMSGNFKLNQETNKWPDQEQYIIGYDDYGRHERKVIDLDFSVSRYPDVIKDDRFNNPVLFRHNKKVISPVESWQKKRSHSPAMLRINKRSHSPASSRPKRSHSPVLSRISRRSPSPLKPRIRRSRSPMVPRRSRRYHSPVVSRIRGSLSPFIHNRPCSPFEVARICRSRSPLINKSGNMSHRPAKARLGIRSRSREASRLNKSRSPISFRRSKSSHSQISFRQGRHSRSPLLSREIRSPRSPVVFRRNKSRSPGVFKSNRLQSPVLDRQFIGSHSPVVPRLKRSCSPLFTKHRRFVSPSRDFELASKKYRNSSSDNSYCVHSKSRSGSPFKNPLRSTRKFISPSRKFEPRHGIHRYTERLDELRKRSSSPIRRVRNSLKRSPSSSQRRSSPFMSSRSSLERSHTYKNISPSLRSHIPANKYLSSPSKYSKRSQLNSRKSIKRSISISPERRYESPKRRFISSVMASPSPSKSLIPPFQSRSPFKEVDHMKSHNSKNELYGSTMIYNPKNRSFNKSSYNSDRRSLSPKENLNFSPEGSKRFFDTDKCSKRSFDSPNKEKKMRIYREDKSLSPLKMDLLSSKKTSYTSMEECITDHMKSHNSKNELYGSTMIYNPKDRSFNKSSYVSDRRSLSPKENLNFSPEGSKRFFDTDKCSKGSFDSSPNKEKKMRIYREEKSLSPLKIDLLSSKKTSSTSMEECIVDFSSIVGNFFKTQEPSKKKEMTCVERNHQDSVAFQRSLFPSPTLLSSNSNPFRKETLNEDIIFVLLNRHREECDNFRRNPHNYPSYDEEKSSFMEKKATMIAMQGLYPSAQEIIDQWKSYWEVRMEELFKADWIKIKNEYYDIFTSSGSVNNKKLELIVNKHKSESKTNDILAESLHDKFYIGGGNYKSYNELEIKGTGTMEKIIQPLTFESNIKEGTFPIANKNIDTLASLSTLVELSNKIGMLGVHLNMLYGRALELNGKGIDPVNVIDENSLNCLRAVKEKLLELMKAEMSSEESALVLNGLRNVTILISFRPSKFNDKGSGDSNLPLQFLQNIDLNVVANETLGFSWTKLFDFIKNLLMKNDFVNVGKENISKIVEFIVEEQQNILKLNKIEENQQLSKHAFVHQDTFEFSSKKPMSTMDASNFSKYPLHNKEIFYLDQSYPNVRLDTSSSYNFDSSSVPINLQNPDNQSAAYLFRKNNPSTGITSQNQVNYAYYKPTQHQYPNSSNFNHDQLPNASFVTKSFSNMNRPNKLSFDHKQNYWGPIQNVQQEDLFLSNFQTHSNQNMTRFSGASRYP